MKDLRGRAAILRRLERAGAGQLGDIKPVGGGVVELRVDVGPGYRLYAMQRGKTLILLLCGGDIHPEAGHHPGANHGRGDRIMTLETFTPFDPAQYLDSEEMMAEYLSQVMADGDAEELLAALGHLARARGMGSIAAATGLGRESLYKVFAPGAKPRFETVMKIVKALGLKLQALPV